MELLDFEADGLYFDPLPAPELAALLIQAATAVSEADAELHLLRAYLRAPDNLRVLLALFRHYHGVGRLPEAASAAERLAAAAAWALDFPEDWREVDRRHLSRGVGHSIGLLRFYLLALKARAAVGLRLKQVDMAREMLLKVRELDGADRLGAAALIAIVDHRRVPTRGALP